MYNYSTDRASGSYLTPRKPTASDRGQLRAALSAQNTERSPLRAALAAKLLDRIAQRAANPQAFQALTGPPPSRASRRSPGAAKAKRSSKKHRSVRDLMGGAARKAPSARAARSPRRELSQEELQTCKRSAINYELERQYGKLRQTIPVWRAPCYTRGGDTGQTSPYVKLVGKGNKTSRRSIDSYTKKGWTHARKRSQKLRSRRRR